MALEQCFMMSTDSTRFKQTVASRVDNQYDYSSATKGRTLEVEVGETLEPPIKWFWGVVPISSWGKKKNAPPPSLRSQD